MNRSIMATVGTVPTIERNLEQQARPRHGVVSAGLNPGAQLPLDFEEVQRHRQFAWMGGSVAVACPVRAVAGSALGAVAGALDAAVFGTTLNADAASGCDTQAMDVVKLHVEDSGGGGRPVVLIHGWPLSAQAWAPQVSVLHAAGYRVVAYDRRCFGRSDKPHTGYSYDTLADDLQSVMDQCGLQDVTLVGFSMGGGEVARYISRHGESRLHSVVFAAAVPPYLMKTADNPDGPLTPDAAQQKKQAFEHDRSAYFEQFTQAFFSAHGKLLVTESQRQEAIALCHQSAPHAALACMDSFATTDFRDDLMKVKVPTLVIHGDADAIVPIEGSGQRTHRAVSHSQLASVSGAPHGLNLSHAQVFNEALLSFLRI
jgi:non-heme chloroperoxidase